MCCDPFKPFAARTVVGVQLKLFNRLSTNNKQASPATPNEEARVSVHLKSNLKWQNTQQGSEWPFQGVFVPFQVRPDIARDPCLGCPCFHISLHFFCYKCFASAALQCSPSRPATNKIIELSQRCSSCTSCGSAVKCNSQTPLNQGAWVQPEIDKHWSKL